MDAKFSESKAPLKKVVGIQFSALGPKQIENMSVTKAFYDASGNKRPAGIFEYNNIYDPETKKPVTGGINDLRLGSTFNAEDCGNFGHIVLARPQYHYGFLGSVLDILRCVSFYDSKILISEEDILKISKNYKKKKRLREIFRLAQKIKVCPTTGLGLPSYKKEGLKIVVEHTNMELQGSIEKYFTLDTLEAYRILEMITDKDACILGLNPKFCRPENLMIKILAVPPPHVRPNILMSSTQRCEDDITHKLKNILKANITLDKVIKNGSAKHIIESFENTLQYHISTYFDNKIPGQKPDQQRSGKPLKTLRQRLVGKEGRVRGNLMGKRVDFSARTVITGDPNLSIDQVGVPVNIAKNLTIPDRVNEHNIEHLQMLVNNGPNKHPGAKYVIITNKMKDNSIGKKIKKIDLNYVKNGVILQLGNIVERHLDNDDVVLFNRQPSLHRMSIMAHRVVVQEGLTFRINLSVCAPYNADFDGDEMNLHVPQSLVARAEAEELMKVEKQIISPQSNRPVMGIIQDALLSSSLLTRRDVFIERHDMCNIVMAMNQVSDPLDYITEPKPFLYINLDKYHIENGGINGSEEKSEEKSEKRDENMSGGPRFYRLWSGKQMFSLTIQGLRGLKLVKNSMECPDTETDFAETDRKILIQNGELLRGIIDKKTIGQVEGSLIHIIALDYGQNIIKNFMNRVQKLANYWILRNSFSIGIADTVISKDTKNSVNKILEDVKKRVEKLVAEKQFSAIRLESDILKELNGARDEAGRLVQNELSYKNNFKNTIACGSKGNILNISQITSLLGQQNIEGHRVVPDFTDRTLPHYQKDDSNTLDINHESVSKGFVENSYFSGLNPQEFFFHSKAGREGVIDTACKSVTSNTEIVIGTQNGLKIVKIGEWIDNLLELNQDKIVEKHNIINKNENDGSGSGSGDAYVDISEILDITNENICIYNTTNEGTMLFSPITQVVKHLPGTKIFRIETKSGRIVEVIDSESLLVWSKETMTFEPLKTSLVKIGSYLPSTLKLDNYIDEIAKEELRLNGSNYVSTTFGNEFNDGLFVAMACLSGTIVQTDSEIRLCFDVTSKKSEKIQFLINYFNNRGSFTYHNDNNKIYFVSEFISNKMDSLKQWSSNILLGTVCSEEFISGFLTGLLDNYDTIYGVDLDLISSPLASINSAIEIKVPREQNHIAKAIIHYSARLGFLVEMYEGISYTYLGLTKKSDIHKKYSVQESVFLDPVVNINRIIPESGLHDYVYDITVPGTFNFCLANGLNVRDTSDTGYLQRKLVKAQEDLIIKYDYSVRDLYNNIIQFLYGEDGMNGSNIENQDLMVNCSDTEFTKKFIDNDTSKIIIEEIDQLKKDREFSRKITDVLFYPGEKVAEKVINLPVNIHRIINRVTEELCINKTYDNTSDILDNDRFLDTKEIYQTVKSFIESFNYGITENSMTLFKMHMRYNLSTKVLGTVTYNQLKLIFAMIAESYKSALVVPGEMCGVIAAQSLSGPLTQMTLNSFHSSGLAHSITLGVPRFKELVHISKNIKSPTLNIFPIKGIEPDSLRNKLEFKTLRSFIKKSFVCKRMYLNDNTGTFDAYRSFDSIENTTIYDYINKIIISNEVLEYTGLTMANLLDFIIFDKKVKDELLNNINIEVSDDNIPEPFIVLSVKKTQHIIDTESESESELSDSDSDIEPIKEYEDHEITSLLKDIEISYINKIKIQGLPGINRVFVSEKNKDIWNEDTGSYISEKQKYIETEGSNLVGSFSVSGIDHRRTISNNVIDVFEVLGIEAARRTLLNELKYVLSFDSSYVNYRHLALLVDVITARGALCSLTRHGLNKDSNVSASTLAKCSFEETVEILMDASVYSQKDLIKGVSENIMLGQLAPCGTGSFSVLLDHEKYIDEDNIIEYRPPSPELPDWL